MFDQEGNPDSQYWVARHRLRKEFGLTAEEADNEPAEEAAIHFAIWNKQSEREKWEQRQSEMRSKMNHG